MDWIMASAVRGRRLTARAHGTALETNINPNYTASVRTAQ